jgi:hypothetical protein
MKKTGTFGPAAAAQTVQKTMETIRTMRSLHLSAE